MTDLTVQRTLVKSPPELWSELSEVEGLARHLGEFGEIRITRAAPETTVAWEGEHASGTVEIEASGWGTKVTLTAAVVDPEPAPAEPAPAEPAPQEPAAAKPVEPPAAPLADHLEPAESEPDRGRLSDELDRIAERAQDSYWNELVHWGDREQDEPTPEPRRGRFARFFRRRPRRDRFDESIAAEQAEDAGEPQAVAPNEPKPVAAQPKPATVNPTLPEAAVPVEPEAAVPVEPAADAPAEPATAIAPDHARAVLEHALDNLGAAHHRPFSRG